MTTAGRYRYLDFAVASIISLVLSFLAAWQTQVINPDAICYLQSAKTIAVTGVHAAMAVCDQAKWPFYACLINALVKLTSWSYVTAAYTLDAFLSLLSVLAFMGLVRHLGGSPRVVRLAACVILLAHEFNAVRDYIIRDHGFWAFYLVSLIFFIDYLRVQQWRYALAWSASLIIATLFRIEGVIFLAALPWVAWWCPTHKLKSFLQLNTILIGLLVGLGVAEVIHPLPQLGRLNEVQFQIVHGVNLLAAHFSENATALAGHVLSPFAARDASLILGLLLVSWYIVSVALNLSLIYSVLVVYAWCRKALHIDNPAKRALIGYIVINVIVTFLFLVENMFLSKRYLVALSLVLMLGVPFALEQLVKQWSIRKWPLVVATLCIFLSAVGGIVHVGHSKAYVREAGDWLAVNAPPSARIYSNVYQVLYYSRHFENTIFAVAREQADPAALTKGRWKHYDYIALECRHSKCDAEATIEKQMGLTPIKIFANQRGDEIKIYLVNGRK